MRRLHPVSDATSPLIPVGDHTTPSALDRLVVGFRSGFPPCSACTTTDSPLRRGSTTGNAALELGAARLYSVGGLNAVPLVARNKTDSVGRSSMPACQVVLAPKSL